jgi:hypothetical protein
MRFPICKQASERAISRRSKHDIERTGWNVIRIHEDGIHEAHSLHLMSGADTWQARAFMKDGCKHADQNEREGEICDAVFTRETVYVRRINMCA